MLAPLKVLLAIYSALFCNVVQTNVLCVVSSRVTVTRDILCSQLTGGAKSILQLQDSAVQRTLTQQAE
jgi:hypothetical protein